MYIKPGRPIIIILLLFGNCVSALLSTNHTNMTECKTV